MNGGSGLSRRDRNAGSSGLPPPAGTTRFATPPPPVKPEARAVGGRVDSRWWIADSLSLRFGLLGNRHAGRWMVERGVMRPAPARRCDAFRDSALCP